MRNTFALALAAGTVLLGMEPCRAAPIVLLSSPDPDLNNLTPGQIITINVALAGLNPGDRLDFLAATLVFEDTVLGLPAITRGPIVPDPGGFLQAGEPGLADALYDTLLAPSREPIVSNGTFFTFDAPVTGFGEGSVAFRFVGASGVDAAGNPLPAVTGGASLRITSVPEPSTFVLVGLGALCLLGHGWRRRKRVA